MKTIWMSDAWDDYLYWFNQDRKTIKRINTLIKDICANGNESGIGKPEALKYDLHGYFSRRIDDTNRLVYVVDEGGLNIISCRYHYE